MFREEVTRSTSLSFNSNSTLRIVALRLEGIHFRLSAGSVRVIWVAWWDKYICGCRAVRTEVVK